MTTFQKETGGDKTVVDVMYLTVNGTFYTAYGKLAKIVSRATGYKVIRKVNNAGFEDFRLGFPTKCIHEVLSKLMLEYGDVLSFTPSDGGMYVITAYKDIDVSDVKVFDKDAKRHTPIAILEQINSYDTLHMTGVDALNAIVELQQAARNLPERFIVKDEGNGNSADTTDIQGHLSLF